MGQYILPKVGLVSFLETKINVAKGKIGVILCMHAIIRKREG